MMYGGSTVPDKSLGTIRTSVALTGSFVAMTSADVSDKSWMVVVVSVDTLGTLTGYQVQYEASFDGTNWIVVRVEDLDLTTGVGTTIDYVQTPAAISARTFMHRCERYFGRYMRASIKATGGTGGGDLVSATGYLC